MREALGSAYCEIQKRQAPCLAAIAVLFALRRVSRRRGYGEPRKAFPSPSAAVNGGRFETASGVTSRCSEGRLHV